MLKKEKKSARLVGEIKSIDVGSVKGFFQSRAELYNESESVVAVLFQDHDVALAEERDKYEKGVLLSLMGPQKGDRVLDIGCGIGRWATVVANSVEKYHGTDFLDEFIEIARRQCDEHANCTFQRIAAEEISHESLMVSPPFNIILVAGLLHYVNDESLKVILGAIKQCATTGTRVVIRGPLAIDSRLTLDNIWSEELQSHYSAIYRSIEEMHDLFREFLPEFAVNVSEPLFPVHLNNRDETMQFVFQLTR